mgnify:CR=1 FL=1
MFRLLAFFIISIVTLSGCATTATQEAFDEQAQQWIGKNADELVRQKGPPTRTFILSNGNRVFQYERTEDIVTMPATTYIPGGPMGGSMVRGQTVHEDPLRTLILTCSLRFTIDTSNTIIAWSKEGNSCVARPDVKK